MNTPVRRRVLATSAAVMLIGAACTGDDDAGPTTTELTVVASTGSPGTTTAPTTVTTEALTPTTQAPPPSSAPPTTASAPTTEPSDDAVRQAVLDAVVESWRVFNEAKLDPFDDDKVAAIADVRGGQLLTDSTEFIAQYRVNGEKSVTNPVAPATLRPDPTTLVFASDRSSATVESCRVNSNLVVVIGGNDDGTDRVIDDSISVFIETAVMELRDRGWVETGGEIIERFEGAVTCPD